jgi:hypothetical protein
MESLPHILTNHPIITNVTNSITQNNAYPKIYNPKYDLIERIFGPLIDLLLTYKISGMWFAFILVFILFYFRDYKEYKRTKEISVSFTQTLPFVIIIFIVSVVMQIVMCSQVPK